MAFAAILADVLVGVSALISLTALTLGALTTTGSTTGSTSFGSSAGVSASSSVLAAACSSSENSGSATTSTAFGFFSLTADLPRDLDLLVPAFFIILEVAL